jgi:hypothetical protein
MRFCALCMARGELNGDRPRKSSGKWLDLQ